MNTLTFDIKGMSCGGCAARVEHAVRRLDGVERVDVELRPPLLRVEVDMRRVTADRIESTLARLDFLALALARARVPEPNERNIP